jgi:large subunit ribosomal protein L29
MATKKYLELQDMSVETMNQELKQAQTDLKRMVYDHGAKGLQNPLELKAVRKDIARLKTEIRARELKGMTTEQLAKRSKIRLTRRINK